MRLSKFIADLQKQQAELGTKDPIVALADWQEQYKPPSEYAAEVMGYDDYQDLFIIGPDCH